MGAFHRVLFFLLAASSFAQEGAGPTAADLREEREAINAQFLAPVGIRSHKFWNLPERRGSYGKVSEVPIDQMRATSQKNWEQFQTLPDPFVDRDLVLSLAEAAFFNAIEPGQAELLVERAIAKLNEPGELFNLNAYKWGRGEQVTRAVAVEVLAILASNHPVARGTLFCLLGDSLEGSPVECRDDFYQGADAFAVYAFQSFVVEKLFEMDRDWVGGGDKGLRSLFRRMLMQPQLQGISLVNTQGQVFDDKKYYEPSFAFYNLISREMTQHPNPDTRIAGTLATLSFTRQARRLELEGGTSGLEWNSPAYRLLGNPWQFGFSSAVPFLREALSDDKVQQFLDQYDQSVGVDGSSVIAHLLADREVDWKGLFWLSVALSQTNKVTFSSQALSDVALIVEQALRKCRGGCEETIYFYNLMSPNGKKVASTVAFTHAEILEVLIEEWVRRAAKDKALHSCLAGDTYSVFCGRATTLFVGHAEDPRLIPLAIHLLWLLSRDMSRDPVRALYLATELMKIEALGPLTEASPEYFLPVLADGASSLFYELSYWSEITNARESDDAYRFIQGREEAQGRRNKVEAAELLLFEALPENWVRPLVYALGVEYRVSHYIEGPQTNWEPDYGLSDVERFNGYASPERVEAWNPAESYAALLVTNALLDRLDPSEFSQTESDRFFELRSSVQLDRSSQAIDRRKK